MDAFSLTSGVKFLSLEKLMQTAPSRIFSSGTLYLSPGTPLITTSLMGRQSSSVQPGLSTTSCLRFRKPTPRVNS